MKTGNQVLGKTQRKFAGTFSHVSQQSNALSGKASGNENVEAPSQEKNGNELNTSDVGHSSSNTTKVIQTVILSWIQIRKCDKLCWKKQLLPTQG